MSNSSGIMVAIVGRTNVGKSTLFNCLTEKSKAIVSKIKGTTRDRNYGQALWRGREITVVDTGGLDAPFKKRTFSLNKLDQLIEDQVRISLSQTDLVLFLVDAQTGPLPEDRTLAKFLQKNKKPVLLVANKVDNPKLRNEFETQKWQNLGLGQPLAISALNGSGTGDLLDKIFKTTNLSKKPYPLKKEKVFQILIIGKPNVGKSSFINALLGEKRVIVSEIPHTTREPQDTLIYYKEEPLLLIDSAGIRKRTKIKEELIKAGITKTLKLIKKADLIFFMVEGPKPLTTLDSHLAGLILKNTASILIMANKRDLWQKEAATEEKEFKNYFYRHFPYLTWVPILFTSSLTGRNVNKALAIALEIKEAREKTISDKAMERFFKKIIKKHRPVGTRASIKSHLTRARYPYIYTLKQTGSNPPKFTATLGQGQSLSPHYLRFIENQIREKFGFLGTPLKIEVAIR